MAIKLTKCDHELVKETLAVLKLDTDGSLKKCVERLSTHYKEHEERLEIAGCDQCGGDSDSQLDNCPFCGEGGVMDDGVPVGQDAPPPPKKKAAKKKSAAEVCIACEGSGKASKGGACGPCNGTGKQGDAPENKKAPPKKKGAKKIVKPPPPKKKAAKKAAKKVQPPPPKKKAKKAKKAQPPKPKVTKVVSSQLTVTVQMLDAQVTIIRQQVTNGAIALHAMGAAFAVIRDTESWKTRMDPDKHGVPLHSNFKMFCQAELGMHFTHVFRAMAVAKEFEAEELEGLSGQQIRVVMQLPKGTSRDEALGAAKGGEKGGKLSERAKGLQGDKAPAAKPPAPKAVTVALTPGIQKVSMYKRPTKGAKVADTENATPAKSIADKPWFALDMSNNVRLIVRLAQGRDGSWQATVEHRRGEKT